MRLIDTARVRPLPVLFTRKRWIAKDLAQFWYSTLGLAVSDEQRQAVDHDLRGSRGDRECRGVATSDRARPAGSRGTMPGSCSAAPSKHLDPAIDLTARQVGTESRST